MVRTLSAYFRIICSKGLYMLVSIFFLISFVFSSIIVPNSFTESTNPPVGILLIAVLIIFCMIPFLSFMNKRLFFVFLMLLAFGIRFIWILHIRTPLVSDFQIMYDSAVSTLNGDFSFTSTQYYTAWAYQLGFTMYEALMMKIFGNSVFMLTLWNVIWSSGTTILIYKTASTLFGELCGRIAGIFYSLYIPNIVMCSVLTNEHISTFLFYCGFYFIIRNGINTKLTWLYSGILISLGNVMRPLGSLILLAIIIYVILFEFIGLPDKILTTSKLVGFLVAYYLIHFLISYSFIAADIAKYPLTNQEPYWKFVLGFNHETTGQYSREDRAYVVSFPIGDERNKQEKALIHERISNKDKVATLFIEKAKIMWGGDDASLSWSLGKLDKEHLKQSLSYLERIIYIIIAFFGFLSSVFLLLKGKRTKQNLFLLLVIGYVLVHLLIEIQTRYRSFIIPSFVIIQSYSIACIYQTIRGALPNFPNKDFQ